MTENPNESQPNPPESPGIPATTETAAEPDAEVEITVDHVYLPLDAASTPPAIAASSALENVRPSQIGWTHGASRSQPVPQDIAEEIGLLRASRRIDSHSLDMLAMSSIRSKPIFDSVH